ncbi:MULTISPECIES: hypothetical protein [Myroides]|uniref:50S ribosomal protein L27 n=1 Tax=Myroides albus TaxID=2562892 RepID=A0A6I3LGG1_9FLAO|nr:MULTISPECIES: hypothetical protein [Myroides]MTG97568.1 hypothetical protein [Myroides albus]MVX36105.1 hypothetical protein [Myroides sp. LoEW2-1]UVD81157.1 hypothetical protein NWE55_07950 [Myroides albus]
MEFSTIIKQAHSGVAYLAIIFLAIAIINAFAGASAKRQFTDKDKKFGLFALIFTHIQLLLGLILYFVSPMVHTLNGSMGEVMKNSALRLYGIEHPMINILAIVLITIGWSKHKKATDDNSKFKKFTIFYTIGLILILSRIPWSNWLPSIFG